GIIGRIAALGTDGPVAIGVGLALLGVLGLHVDLDLGGAFGIEIGFAFDGFEIGGRLPVFLFLAPGVVALGVLGLFSPRVLLFLVVRNGADILDQLHVAQHLMHRAREQGLVGGDAAQLVERIAGMGFDLGAPQIDDRRCARRRLQARQALAHNQRHGVGE